MRHPPSVLQCIATTVMQLLFMSHQEARFSSAVCSNVSDLTTFFFKIYRMRSWQDRKIAVNFSGGGRYTTVGELAGPRVISLTANPSTSPSNVPPSLELLYEFPHGRTPSKRSKFRGNALAKACEANWNMHTRTMQKDTFMWSRDLCSSKTS